MLRRTSVLGSSFTILLLVLGTTTCGATDRAGISQVEVGFAGKYKVGFWTAVRVTVGQGPMAASRVRIELVAQDNDGIPVSYRGPERNIQLAVGEQLTFTEYVKFGRLRGSLTVRLLGEHEPSERELIDERRVGDSELVPALSANQPLLVTLGKNVGIDEAARLAFPAGSLPVSVLIDDPDSLPDHWWGYDAVHTIILPTSDFEWLGRLRTAQTQALDRWLRLGGRVLMSVGKNGATLAATSPWSEWLPGQFEEVGSLRRTVGIESYAAAEHRLGGADGQSRIDFSSFRDLIGRVDATETLANQAERPVVVRYPVSFGNVTLLTIDLDTSPISDWLGRPRLLTKVLQGERIAQAEVQTRESHGQVVHLGFDDLVGQLRTALEQFPGVTPIAFGWIVTIVIGYIGVIGPADYFLHRKLGRPEATWLTFPLAALLLAAAAVGIGAHIKDQRLRLNQVDVIDVELSTGLARGTTWLNVYSPSSGTADWSLRPDPINVPTAGQGGAGELLMSWQGVPGRGVGGLANTAGSLLSSGSYATRLPKFAAAREGIGESASSGTLEGLPIAIASTRFLSGRWDGQVALQRDFALRSETLDGQLQGRLANPWPFPLAEWALLHGNWMYRGEGVLQPGDEISLNQYSNARYLDWHLTRRRVSTENKDVTTPWDEQSTDVARIVEMMLFHRSAGGQSYTRIGHRYQAYLDLTEQLRLGSAVLVAKGPAAFQPLRDGEPVVDSYDQQVAFYRVTVPVAIGRGVPAAK